MIDTDLENYVKDLVFKTLKEIGITPESSMQTTLQPNDVDLEEELQEYMADKQCLIWLSTNEKGEKQGIKCNQFYIAKRGSMRVDKSIPLTFEEVFHIWESYFKGNKLEDIYWTVPFDYDNVGLSDLRLVVWALIHGKCNFMLSFIKEDRYLFDFKKYEGRF